MCKICFKKRAHPSVSLLIFYQYDFQTYVSDRSQCFKSHGVFDFAYKLQVIS